MTSTASRYDYRFDVHGESTAAQVCRLIGHDRRVLELGCAAGAMSAVLKHHYNCRVVGFEYDEKAAQAAREYCDTVITASLDTPDWSALLPPQTSFDAVLAADVFEHLHHPEQCLSIVRHLLPDHGKLVVSVPNIAHSGVMASLLCGQFNYQDVGLLDRTHVHFFTADSLARLLKQCGFRVVQQLTSDAGSWHPEFQNYWNALPAGLQAWLEANPAGKAYQVIMLAEPDPQARTTREASDTLIPASVHHVESDGAIPDTQQAWLTTWDQATQAAEQQVAALRQQLSDLEQGHEQLQLSHQHTVSELSETVHSLQLDLQAQEQRHHEAMQALYRSLSWRITRPLRGIKRLFSRR